MLFFHRGSGRIAALVAIALSSATPALADAPGSYVGVSTGFNRDGWSDRNIAVDGVWSITDNIELRGSLAEDSAAIAPTVSISTGDFRFATGIGVEWQEKDYARDDGEWMDRADSLGVMGLLAAEVTVFERGVVYSNLMMGDRAVSGSLGVGYQFD